MRKPCLQIRPPITLKITLKRFPTRYMFASRTSLPGVRCFGGFHLVSTLNASHIATQWGTSTMMQDVYANLSIAPIKATANKSGFLNTSLSFSAPDSSLLLSIIFSALGRSYLSIINHTVTPPSASENPKPQTKFQFLDKLPILYSMVSCDLRLRNKFTFPHYKFNSE